MASNVESLTMFLPVYNILMDFVLALFPWAITWKLKMRRYEKMALAATMSLGMLVAIVSAVRTWWVGQPIYAAKDELYFWRRAMSNIWSVLFSPFSHFALSRPIRRARVRALSRAP